MREYKVIQGNLLDANVSTICHQVNCQGAMNSGVAKAIRQRYPMVYTDYFELCSEHSPEELLGTAQFVRLGNTPPYVCCNMFAQERYGYDGKQYTSLEAFEKCLQVINKTNLGCSVAFPWKIGCVRGGADWSKVLPLILNTLTDVEDIYFYKID